MKITEEQLEDLALSLNDDVTTITSEEARDLAITFEDALEITYGLDNDDKIMLTEEGRIRIPIFMRRTASKALRTYSDREFSEGDGCELRAELIKKGKITKNAISRILDLAQREHDDFFLRAEISPERERRLAMWGIPPNILGINKVISWCEEVL